MTSADLPRADILDLVAARRESLTPAERAVATAILENPEQVSDLTIAQIAQLARSSEATVTRFCRSLGLTGFAQLRLSLAVAAERRRTGEHSDSGIAMLAELTAQESLEDVVKKVAYFNAQAVDLTASQLDVAVVAQVIDTLAAARRILVFGLGASATAGFDAAHKLAYAGLAAQHASDPHAALMAVSRFGPGDAVLVFTHAGRTAEAVELVNLAVEQGCPAIVVTSDTGSPAARAATLVLGTAAREMTFRSGGVASRIAQLTVVDALFVGLSHRTFDASIEAATRMHDAVRGHVLRDRGATS